MLTPKGTAFTNFISKLWDLILCPLLIWWEKSLSSSLFPSLPHHLQIKAEAPWKKSLTERNWRCLDCQAPRQCRLLLSPGRVDRGKHTGPPGVSVTLRLPWVQTREEPRPAEPCPGAPGSRFRAPPHLCLPGPRVRSKVSSGASECVWCVSQPRRTADLQNTLNYNFPRVREDYFSLSIPCFDLRALQQCFLKLV